MRVTHSHGGILSKHQHRHRLTHDITSSDDHTLFAVYLYTTSLKKFYDTRRSTRNKPGLTDTESPYTLRMETVNILLRINSAYYLIFINMIRQRQLHQNTVDTFILI